MTRASSVTRSAASLLSSRLAVAGIALVFLGVSTRLLTLEEMAVFAVYNTFCGFLTVVCSLGLLATCVKVLPGLTAPGGPATGSAGEATGPPAGGRAEAARLMRLTLVVYVAGAAAVTAALWIAAEPISRLLLKTPGRAADVRVAAAATFCFGLYEAGQLLLSGLQRFGRVGGNNVAAALIQRTLSLALFFAIGLKGYLAGFAVGSLAGAAIGLAGFRRDLAPPAATPGAPGPREGWLRWSMPFYADGYLRYFYMQADQLLVGIFLSPADLSIYFVAKRFIQYCQVLVSSLVDPLGTKVAELRGSDPEAVRRAYAVSLRYFILIFTPFATLLACLTPFLLLVIGGSRYAGAAAPLALLFLSIPFFAVFAHLSVFVYALGPPKERLLSNLVSMAAQAAAIVALMPWLALAGLALARAAGFAAAAVFTRWRVARCLPGGATPPVAARAILQSMPPSALLAALVLAPHVAVGRPILVPLYAAPAAGACLLWYLAAILTPADRAALAAMVPGRGRAAIRIRAAVAGGARPASDAATS